MADDQLTPEALNTAQPKNMAVAAKMREFLARDGGLPATRYPPPGNWPDVRREPVSRAPGTSNTGERRLAVAASRVGTFRRRAQGQEGLACVHYRHLRPGTLHPRVMGFEEEANRRGYHILFCNATACRSTWHNSPTPASNKVPRASPSRHPRAASTWTGIGRSTRRRRARHAAGRDYQPTVPGGGSGDHLRRNP